MSCTSPSFLFRVYALIPSSRFTAAVLKPNLPTLLPPHASRDWRRHWNWRGQSIGGILGGNCSGSSKIEQGGAVLHFTRSFLFYTFALSVSICYTCDTATRTYIYYTNTYIYIYNKSSCERP